MKIDVEATIHEAARERNQGKEPDELHLAYERELWRLRAENDQLRADQAEVETLNERMAQLLTGVANALKGDPPDLVWHDWSDLPAVAARVVAERNGK
jgi:hypothetical protein